METLPGKKAVLDIEVNSKLAVLNEQRKNAANLEKMLAELKKRIAATEESLGEFKNKKNSAGKKLRTGAKTTKRLQEQLEGLKNGSR